ncbi:FliO/MopB family protein [Candidatus Clavichlamydia salmonicola]|uniref:FliO/MopB family protein n=1 Tax=Candidatus Clavichlamydia salmonicola TaxID=469812 RepID=UPI0018916636|nr:flagellar biosynthetic protein FliO [Candidatus Clavichlamydia salmonicola]
MFKRCFIIACIFISPLLSAEEQPSLKSQEITLSIDKEANSEHDPIIMSFRGEFIKMILSLAVLVVILIFGLRIIKRYLASRTQQSNRGSFIKILDRRPLSAKSSIYLISVCNRGLLISDSGGQISLLTEFVDLNDIEGQSTAQNSLSILPSAACNILKKAIKKFSTSNKDSSPNTQ